MGNQKKNNEYFVNFRGAKLKKHEANQVGFGLIAGIIGTILALILFEQDQKLYSLSLVVLFSGFGFWGYRFVRMKNKSKKT